MGDAWEPHSGMGKGLCFPSAPSLGAAVGGLQVRAESTGQGPAWTGHGAVRGVRNRFVLLEILKK